MVNIQKHETQIIRAPKHAGGWLPSDMRSVMDWVERMKNEAKRTPPRRLPSVQNLVNLVSSKPDLYMLFHEMMTEAQAGVKDAKEKYIPFPIGTVDELFVTLDYILQTSPAYTTGADQKRGPDAQIGTPINGLLLWPMATKAGFAVFLRPDVNLALQAILNDWGVFLTTTDSCSTLNDQPGGWFSPAALDYDPHMKDFDKTYVCQKAEPHWGFTSWDNFFTRPFLPGVRPISHPDDDSVIVNAAESTYFAKQSPVKLRDTFWLKGQPYSLYHMLDGDNRAKGFVGGSVYQAFLSADSYHRWHAPVSGQIVDYKLVPGTYYSEPVLFSFDPDDGDVQQLDEGADDYSQGYISAVAARGLIWIQADNKDIGLMCMIVIGMAEVSTIEVTQPLNVPFKKGDELGMFHFGGSTHCLVFGPHVTLDWNIIKDSQSLLGTTLATVV